MKSEDRQFDEHRLDEALEDYGKAEPRAGLENRILVNLAGERERLVERRWRWRFPAVTLACGVAVIVGFFLTRKPDSPSVNVVKQAPSTNTSQELRGPATSNGKALAVVKPTIHGKSYRQLAKPAIEPRLEQFPSPTPLNEQEEMLVRYVRERRQEAVMVARARAELLKADLLKFQQPPGTEADSER